MKTIKTSELPSVNAQEALGLNGNKLSRTRIVAPIIFSTGVTKILNYTGRDLCGCILINSGSGHTFNEIILLNFNFYSSNTPKISLVNISGGQPTVKAYCRVVGNLREIWIEQQSTSASQSTAFLFANTGVLIATPDILPSDAIEFI